MGAKGPGRKRGPQASSGAPAPSPARLAAGLERALEAVGTPERAEEERRYLRSELTHLGASVPAVRRAATELRRAWPGLDREQVLGLVDRLWARPVHECRLAAVELLDLFAGQLEEADLPRLERWLLEARTWALLDPLAVLVAGPLLERLPGPTAAAALERWAAHPDFWLRRAALLAELRALREGRGDWDRFAGHADAMLEEREFFVRKAIGWVLRDTSRRRPGLVAAWLGPRARRASGVTLREALRHLPEPARRRLLAAAGPRPGRTRRP